MAANPERDAADALALARIAAAEQARLAAEAAEARRQAAEQQPTQSPQD